VKFLLDTHTVLWWLDDHPRLSAKARQLITDSSNECWLSTVSVFEIASKHRLGKLLLPPTLLQGWSTTAQKENWRLLPVTLEHAAYAGTHPSLHGDPFDRLLAAQSKIEDLTLLTIDPAFASFASNTVW
jgi:PIN domain nuclease of toxin-antitoxin system